MPKEEFFKPTIEKEEMARLRDAIAEFPDDKAPAVALKIRPLFPNIAIYTLERYVLSARRATHTTFSLYMEGKLSAGAFEMLTRWENGDQDFMVKEYLERKMGVEDLKRVRRIMSDQACGYDEAISKALGEMPVHQPREHKPRSFDTVLDEINKLSAKWRGLMSMALDLVGEEEAKAGIHNLLFQRAYLLRHTIKENYDFANSKVNRYFNFIKKKYKAAAEMSSAEPEFMEGAADGNRAGTGQEGLDREAGADVQDGPPLPDQSGEGEGEGQLG